MKGTVKYSIFLPVGLAHPGSPCWVGCSGTRKISFFKIRTSIMYMHWRYTSSQNSWTWWFLSLKWNRSFWQRKWKQHLRDCVDYKQLKKGVMFTDIETEIPKFQYHSRNFFSWHGEQFGGIRDFAEKRCGECAMHITRAITLMCVAEVAAYLARLKTCSYRRKMQLTHALSE